MNRSLIPNTITSLNLFAGCVGIVYSFQGDLKTACMFIWLAAVLDFLDGLLARGLNAYSELGKQLDSLADMISFGALPGMILFHMLSSNTTVEYLPFLAFLVTVFSAIRLAKFNIDEDQATSFKGLPTPASALFVSGLPFIGFMPIGQNLLIAVIIALAILMVSNLPLMALKFKNTAFKDNWPKLLLILVSILLLALLHLEALSLIIFVYLGMSLVFSRKNT